MNFLGFGQSAEIHVLLDGEDNRKWVELKQDANRRLKCPVYYDGETISGKVELRLKKPGQKFEHQGIRIEFLGLIELYSDRSTGHEFISLVRELARPGELRADATLPFEFSQVEKPYESYAGANVRLRYVLRVTVGRRISDQTHEMELAVHTLWQFPEQNQNIRMEVGIEGCLHIEFEYNKSKYHLRDVIVGKVYFLLVRVKIKHMELQILRRETTGAPPQPLNETETIAKYEIMDGAPVKGESIPIRLFLSGYELTPTMRDVQKRFSVRYFLNLVLVDEEERRYFKQQEITLYRKAERRRRPVLQQPGAAAASSSSSYTSSNPSAIARLDASTALGPSVPLPTPPPPSAVIGDDDSLVQSRHPPSTRTPTSAQVAANSSSSAATGPRTQVSVRQDMPPSSAPLGDGDAGSDDDNAPADEGRPRVAPRKHPVPDPAQ